MSCFIEYCLSFHAMVWKSMCGHDTFVQQNLGAFPVYLLFLRALKLCMMVTFISTYQVYYLYDVNCTSDAMCQRMCTAIGLGGPKTVNK